MLRFSFSFVRIHLCLCALFVIAPAVPAQTIDDGIMIPRKRLCAGALYGRDSFSSYWEGARERTNGNIGTVTTQSVDLMADYGLTGRINLLADAPYIWTRASAGVLHGQSGFQDFTLAVKANVLRVPVRQIGTLRLIAVLTGSTPLTNYTPDLEPLSIGTQSTRGGGRATLNFIARRGLFVNGGAGYLFRGNVKLDRSSYFTNNQLYLSDEVALPNVFDYLLQTGYRHNDLELTGMFAQQQTRGGGDIRRQDLPFVSNRQNASRAGLTVKWPLPHAHDIQYWFKYANTFEGRNVGQSNTIATGLMCTLHLEKRASH